MITKKEIDNAQFFKDDETVYEMLIKNVPVLQRQMFRVIAIEKTSILNYDYRTVSYMYLHPDGNPEKSEDYRFDNFDIKENEFDEIIDEYNRVDKMIHNAINEAFVEKFLNS